MINGLCFKCTVNKNSMKLQKIFEVSKQKRITTFCFLFIMKSTFLLMQFQTKCKILILPTFLQKCLIKISCRFFCFRNWAEFLWSWIDWYYQAAYQACNSEVKWFSMWITSPRLKFTAEGTLNTKRECKLHCMWKTFGEHLSWLFIENITSYSTLCSPRLCFLRLRRLLLTVSYLPTV